MADSTPKRPIAALIVAAGRGTRLTDASDGLAKQYIELSGRTILARAIQPFLDHSAITHVQVVIHPDDASRYRMIATELHDPVGKLLECVEGGETRQASTFNGIQHLAKQSTDKILIHDAARPFVNAGTIDALLQALESADGAIPALAVADTLKRADSNLKIEETVPRAELWRAQTPQAFHFQMLQKAHQEARQQETGAFTDDASIAEAAGLSVRLIPGSESLRKITTREDLDWARNHIERTHEKAMQKLETRVGQGFDVHAFVEGNEVTLCGIAIPHTKRLSGHSDADVGLHALTDAILGALGEGDIGTHFPPSDPKWKGADSVVFLADAVRRVDERHGYIRHVDITLICEVPKIGPHREAMTARLAEVMELDHNRISIKATTTERLGFPGREEGIAAMAIATLVLPIAK